MTRPEVVLAIDVGGTTVKSALVAVEGRVLERDVRPTSAGDEAVRNVLASARLLAGAAAARGLDVVGAGVCSPGLVDSASGTVRYAANLGWRDVGLRDLVGSVVDVPVAVGHDVRAAGLAEGALGSARGCADYVHLALGTGIAATLVVGGRVLLGADSGAGEVGHACVQPDGERCSCGQVGCMEVYAGGGGLANRYRRLTGREATAAELLALRATDPAADQVWREGIEALATGLATCTLLLDPSVIVLGGGVAKAGAALVDPLALELQTRLAWRRAPRIALARLGADAAVVGTALLAMEHVGRAREAARWTADGFDVSAAGPCGGSAGTAGGRARRR